MTGYPTEDGLDALLAQFRVPFGWLELLDAHERRAFAEDFVRTAQDCARDGIYDRLATQVANWHETAEILADPDEVAPIREAVTDLAAGRVYMLEEVAAEMRRRGRLPDVPTDESGRLTGPNLPRLGEPIDLDALLIMARRLTDSGNRTSLDEVIAAFGFDRSELEAELDAEERKLTPRAELIASEGNPERLLTPKRADETTYLGRVAANARRLTDSLQQARSGQRETHELVEPDEVVRARLAEHGESRDFDEFVTEIGMTIDEDGTVSEVAPSCWTLWEGGSLFAMYAGHSDGKAAADQDCATLNARDAADRPRRSREPLYRVVRSELHTQSQFDPHGTRRLP